MLGVRYSLKMLPLPLFELLWKSIWVLVFGLPLLFASQLDPGTTETLIACLMGVVLVPLVMPDEAGKQGHLTASGAGRLELRCALDTSEGAAR
jgi:hypothetical protein